MEKHECTIGIYYDYEETGLATVENFLSYTYWSKGTVEELTDPENKNHFRWFNYCPICGKKIDIDKARKEIIEKSNQITKEL